GLKAEHGLAEQFRSEVSVLLGRGQKSFPGAQPVSFARRHIQELQKRDYYLCEKTDGIRCLLYFTQDGPQEIHYLIDRKNDYYFVRNLHFPLPGDDYSTFHTDTIIDGELVYDKEKDGSLRMRFLVFDCLTLDGKLQTGKPLDKRLAYFKELVFKPWENLFKHKFPQERSHLPFEIEFKEMSFPYAMSWMFDIKLSQLKHGNDGLIFTCRETPYVFGTDEHILKWKPAHENTVDFRLKLGDFPPLTANGSGEAQTQEPDYDAKPSFELMVFHGRGIYKPFAPLYVTDDDWEAMKATNSQLDGRIIECFKDPEHRWRFKRSDDGSPHFRDDKTEANHISTVDSVLESIEDAVSQEDLVRNEGRIRDTFKKRQAEREAHEREKRRKWEEEETRR
ncbi:mRNA capping enzyme, partial [Saccharata proteae CBS 121410]